MALANRKWKPAVKVTILHGFKLAFRGLLVMQVLVMHDGKRLEYDSVPNLLRMQDGAFRAMVEGAGISHEALNH